MKHLKTLSVLLLWSGLTIAQGTPDSISMGALYTNQVFYSLENGEVLSTDNQNWNIAFSVSGQGALGSSILLNEANSSLWAVPQDTSYWSSFDSTGYLAWEELLNSDTSWTNGAFNAYRGASGFFDLGWGILDPSNNYWTFGDSLYLIKLGNGSFKKLWIESLKTGVWEFTYADVDGSNESTVQITKADYPDRNFIYFSLETGTIIDREPDKSSWDITFFKHRDEVAPGMIVSVTGVSNNIGIWSGKSNEVDYNSALNASIPTEFNQNVVNIGREWKKFSGGVWSVYDTIAYFVWNVDSTSLHRIVFTGFGGMSTGKAYFNILKNAVVGVDQEVQMPFISVYPNPADQYIFIKIEDTEEFWQFEIIDLNGRLVYSQQVYSGNAVIDIYDIPAGLYIYQIFNESDRKTGKLLIE